MDSLRRENRVLKRSNNKLFDSSISNEKKIKELESVIRNMEIKHEESTVRNMELQNEELESTIRNMELKNEELESTIRTMKIKNEAEIEKGIFRLEANFNRRIVNLKKTINFLLNKNDDLSAYISRLEKKSIIEQYSSLQEDSQNVDKPANICGFKRKFFSISFYFILFYFILTRLVCLKFLELPSPVFVESLELPIPTSLELQNSTFVKNFETTTFYFVEKL